MTPPSPSGSRREIAVAVLGCLVGAALVLFSAGATWVRLRVAPAGAGSPDAAGALAAAVAVRLTGATVAPAATGLGLVGLAGGVAVLATRRLGRVVVGVLVLAAGAGTAVVAVRVGLDPAGAARGTTQVRQLAPGSLPALRDVRATAASWLVTVGGLLLAGSGLLVVARGRRWSSMSARYEAPARRPVSAWDEIDRGGDPTAAADAANGAGSPDAAGDLAPAAPRQRS
jgi:uncharacterized membrane protein (TIGR02234 family)